MNLRGKHSLSRSLDLSHEGNKGLGVDEILTPGDFEFPVLLDEREGEDGLIYERGIVDGRDQVCRLRRGYGSPTETRRQLCVEGRTCMITFPGASITLWTVT